MSPSDSLEPQFPVLDSAQSVGGSPCTGGGGPAQG